MESTVDKALNPVSGRASGWRRVLQFVQCHIFLHFLLAITIIFWIIGIGVVKLLWFSQMAPATVLKVEVVQEERGPAHTLSVRYRFEGVEYVDHLRVSAQEAVPHKPGDIVQVNVLPENPGRAHLHNENYPSVLVTVILGVIVLVPTYASVRMLWLLFLSRGVWTGERL